MTSIVSDEYEYIWDDVKMIKWVSERRAKDDIDVYSRHNRGG